MPAHLAKPQPPDGGRSNKNSGGGDAGGVSGAAGGGAGGGGAGGNAWLPGATGLPGGSGLTSSSPRRGKGHGVRTALRYLLLVAMAFIVLFPIYMTVVTALFQPSDIVRRPPLLYPPHPNWSDFSQAWSQAHLSEYLRNSALQSIGITVAVLVTSLLAAYAFAFVDFPFKRVFFGVCIASLMVPAEVTIIPNYDTIVRDFHWDNTFQALIVPFMASAVGIFLFRQAFRTLPKELRDAATLDGYGHFKFLTRVVMPLSKPAIGALAVFSFLGSWNQYLWPLLVTQSNSVRTVQIGLRYLVGNSFGSIDVRAAGTILAALPILIVLLLFQRTLVRGLTSGAVKG